MEGCLFSFCFCFGRGSVLFSFVLFLSVLQAVWREERRKNEIKKRGGGGKQLIFLSTSFLPFFFLSLSLDDSAAFVAFFFFFLTDLHIVCHLSICGCFCLTPLTHSTIQSSVLLPSFRSFIPVFPSLLFTLSCFWFFFVLGFLSPSFLYYPTIFFLCSNLYAFISVLPLSACLDFHLAAF